MYCSKKIHIAALGALFTVLAGCGGGEKHEAKKPESLPPVSASVVPAQEATVPDSYEATGTVKARVTSVLSARIMGYIREIRAQVGDSVKAGQVIAVIDAKEVETGMRQAEAARNEARGAMPEVTNAIAAAQAQLDLAESTYQRMKTLLDQKSITNQEFDEVAARRRMAQANLEMARAKRVQLERRSGRPMRASLRPASMKGYTEVLAPFAGTVIERKAKPACSPRRGCRCW